MKNMFNRKSKWSREFLPKVMEREKEGERGEQRLTLN